MYATAGQTHGKAYADAFNSAATVRPMGAGDYIDKINKYEDQRKYDATFKAFQFAGWLQGKANNWSDILTKGYYNKPATDATDRIFKQGAFRTAPTGAMGRAAFGSNIAGQSNPGGVSGSGLESMEKNSSRISSGGPNIITIKQDAMVKNTTIHVQNRDQAVEEIDRLAAEGLMRELGSLAGAFR